MAEFIDLNFLQITLHSDSI